MCHASPDKSAYVRPLAQALARLGVSSWLDEAEIQPGDSIVSAVNDGLRLARFVVVLVTPSLLSRPWPERELNAAFSRETRNGDVVIIPVLVADHDAWAEKYPLLADKLYLSWDQGAEKVAGRNCSTIQPTRINRLGFLPS